MKPASYFKAHASEVIRLIFGENKTMVLIQNEETKAIVQKIFIFTNKTRSAFATSSINLCEAKSRSVKDGFNVIRGRAKND